MQAIAGNRVRAAWRGAGAAILLALAGCTVATPLALESTGTGLPGGTAIAFKSEDKSGSDQERLGGALQRAFAARSLQVDSAGRYLADYAVSFRDAQGGLTTSATAADAKAIDWQARPRNPHVFDNCDVRRMRATLVLLDRQSGAQVYRGEGEATACDFTDDVLDDVAKALVADALGRFAG